MRILIDGQMFQHEEIYRGIGISFVNILNSMLKFDLVNDWYICTPDKDMLKVLDAFAYDRLKILEDKRFSCRDMDCCTESSNTFYTNVLKEYIIQQKIELYWNPNPMMFNVMLPNSELGADSIFTLYDMIPYIFKDQYFRTWTNHQQAEYKRRALYVSKGRVMFISECSRKDFLQYTKGTQDNTKVIYLGVDTKRFNQPVFNKDICSEVLYVGGYDYRKNLDGAIAAFAAAKEKYAGTEFDSAVFNIVCKISDETKDKIYSRLQKLNIADQVVLHGYVSDEKLNELYQTCSVFFFPSLYEGFGMPVLEALALGCNVLCGENSSLTEVGSDYVTYCNSSDTEDMADKLYEAIIIAKDETVEKRKERIEYAESQNWEKTALETLEYITSGNDTDTDIKRVAFVTPWPSQKTGIAEYIYSVIDEIKRYYEITVFVDDTSEKEKFAELDGVEIVSIKKFEDRKNEFDEFMYQLGNNSVFHSEIYKLAEKYPGIIELHDINMNGFFYHMAFSGGGKAEDKLCYKRAIEHFGETGRSIYEPIDFSELNLLERICTLSKKIIVHNRWAKDKISHTGDIYTVPLAGKSIVKIHTTEYTQPIREKYRISPKDYIVSCAGFINDNKRYDKVIEAVSELNKNGYPTTLVFIGSAEINEDKIKKIIARFDIKDKVVITGYVDENDYISAIQATDVMINLRYPTMGESSYTLCQAFACSKPVLVSNVGQYKEFPHEVAWKVDVRENEVSQLVEYISYLFKNPRVRAAMGTNGYNYSKYALSMEKIGRYYKSIICRQQEDK